MHLYRFNLQNNPLKVILAISTVLILSTFISYGQHPSISINVKDKEVILNGAKVNKASKIEDIQRILGQQNRILTKPGVTSELYIYDSLGINFIVEQDSKAIKKIDVYYDPNSAKFETTPKLTFSGKTSINDQLIEKDESIEEVRIKTHSTFEEVTSGISWYSEDNKEFSVIIAYKRSDKSKFNSLYILFNSTK